MQHDSGVVPDPACMIIVKDDDLHVVSAFWSAYGGGHGYDEVRASHPLNKLLATPKVLGQAVRAALKQLYVVSREEDEPTHDVLDELGRGNLKGAREVMICRDKDKATLEFVGAYAFTKNGFENLDKCESSLPDDASDEAVGQAVMDLLKKIAKKAAK